MTLGENITRLRRMHGWSQVDLSQKSGVTQATLSRIEHGKVRQPKLEQLQRLAEVLGTTIDHIIEGEPQPVSEADTAMTDQDRLEWAFQCMISDPEYRSGTSLRTGSELTLDAKRFMVEIYEKATGRKLL